MKRWMSRLSYSFLIIAGVLAYEIYRILSGRRDPIPGWYFTLYIVAAVACLILGLIGLRIRNEEIRRFDRADSGGGPDR